MRYLLLAILMLGAGPTLAAPIDELKPNKVVVQDIQVQLANRGFAVGAPDGALGGKTIKAFDAFVAGEGLADAPFDAQLKALGVDLAAIKNLSFEPDGPYLVIDNGLESGIGELRYQYDWKSFEVGRYFVTDDGEELFTLDDKYCDSYAPPGDQSDCDTGRFRVQVRDTTRPSAVHALYSFDVRTDALPAQMQSIQLAELTQQGGIEATHPETGKPVNYSPRFTLEIQEGQLVITDNSMLDVSLSGGQSIKDASVPERFGEWMHVDFEVIWSTGEDGLFRYWVDGKALWERKGRNATCVPGEGECLLTLKYGPYSSHFEGPSFVDAPIRVAFRNLRKTFTSDAIATAIGGLPTTFELETKREGGPTKVTELTVTEQRGNAEPGFVNSQMHVAIAKAPKGKDEVDFNVQGEFAGDDFVSLQMVLNPPLGKRAPAGLDQCAGPKTTVYDDGQHRAVLGFFRRGTDWVARDVACYKKNTPAEDRFMIDFLLTRFKDMAADMIASGNIAMVRSDEYRGWLEKVAAGEVAIRAAAKGEAPDLTVTEKEGGGAKPGHINSHIHVDIGDVPGKEQTVDFNVQGDMGIEEFLTLQVVLNPPLGKEKPKQLNACAGPKMTQYDDGQYRAVMMFFRKGADWVALDPDCYKAASDEVRFMIDFLLARFKDVAAEMIASGSIGTVRNEAYRAWLGRVAAGEVGVRG